MPRRVAIAPAWRKHLWRRRAAMAATATPRQQSRRKRRRVVDAAAGNGLVRREGGARRVEELRVQIQLGGLAREAELHDVVHDLLAAGATLVRLVDGHSEPRPLVEAFVQPVPARDLLAPRVVRVVVHALRARRNVQLPHHGGKKIVGGLYLILLS